jgi:excisionase family DNA binding protein
MTDDTKELIRETVRETLDLRATERLGYTVDAAAEALGLNPHVIREAISRGELKARKRGRYWLIRRDYLEQWLSARG